MNAPRLNSGSNVSAQQINAARAQNVSRALFQGSSKSTTERRQETDKFLAEALKAQEKSFFRRYVNVSDSDSDS